MRTYEYLDALKDRIGATSDNSVAKAIGTSRQAVSRYRAGIGHFDDQISVRVAEILGLHRGTVLLDMYAERTKDEEIKELWLEIAEGFSVPSTQAKRQMSLRLCRA